MQSHKIPPDPLFSRLIPFPSCSCQDLLSEETGGAAQEPREAAEGGRRAAAQAQIPFRHSTILSKIDQCGTATWEGESFPSSIPWGKIWESHPCYHPEHPAPSKGSFLPFPCSVFPNSWMIPHVLHQECGHPAQGSIFILIYIQKREIQLQKNPPPNSFMTHKTREKIKSVTAANGAVRNELCSLMRNCPSPTTDAALDICFLHKSTF